MFRKKLILISSLAFLIRAVSMSAVAFGDFEYKIINGRSVWITSYNGSDEVVEIPHSIESLRVTVATR
jgi:hypothetical protein